MAIYRFEAKVIARSQGRSATASAAYRAAESIEDERTGTVFDYTRKRGVLYAEIITPPDTPAWMEDRAQLWNAVEKAEKRKDAQLARDLLLSLPHELTLEQRRELVREFVTSEFVAQGMIADLAIHAPDRGADERNYHAHVLLTMRELAGNGFGLKVREWNATAQLEAWREHWADAVNRHLEQHGHAARVDHRSLADQGIDREPEPKQGSVATEMEREGRPSHAGDDRRAAHARNEDRAALQAQLESAAAEIFDLEQERAKRTGQGNMSDSSTDAIAEQQRRAQAQLDEQARQTRAREEEEALARAILAIQLRQAEEMQAQRGRLDAFEAAQKRQAEEVRQEDERKRQAQAQGKAAEGEIRDAGDRYRVALGQHYDVVDPYRSLARAAMAEYGAFIRDREQYTQQIANEQDPEARQAIEMRKQIEFNDYIAITSHRIAGQSEVITGNHNSEEAVRFRERAAEYEAKSTVLRQQYRDLATERAARATDPEARPEPEAAVRNTQSAQPTANTATKEAEVVQQPAQDDRGRVDGRAAASPPPAAEPQPTPTPEPEQQPAKAAQQPAPEEREEANRRAAATLATKNSALAPNPTPSTPAATTDAGMAPQRDARTPAERGGPVPGAAPAPATNTAERAQQDKAEAERRAAELAARREQALKSLKATQAQKEQTQTQNRTNAPPSGRSRT